MALSYKNDEQQDERLSPYSDSVKQLRDQENSGSDYDRSNDGLDDHPVSHGDASGKPGDLYGGASKNIDDAKDREEHGNWTYNGNGNDKQPATGRLSALRRKGPMVSIITLLLTGGAGFSMMIAPGIGIVQLKEVVSGDLNDQLASTSLRSDHVLRAKLKNLSPDASICSGPVKIRCKFSTMSDRQVKNFEKAGFKMDAPPTATNGLTGRRRPATLIAPDGTVIRGPDELTKAAKVNPATASALKKAFNPKFATLADSVANKVFGKFKTNKAQKVKGNTPDEREKAITSSTQGEKAGSDPKTNSVQSDKNGNYILDENGKPVYENTEGEKFKSLKEGNSHLSIGTMAKDSSVASKATSGVLKSGLKGVSITAHIDTACTVFNVANAVSAAAKTARALQLAQYAMVFFVTADRIKAGDATPEEVETLGNTMTSTDTQQMVKDESSIGEHGAVGGEKPNPFYGKNGFDSPGYSVAAYNDAPTLTSRSQQYMIGGGLVGTFSGAMSSVLNTISAGNGKTTKQDIRATCGKIQSWWARGAGLVAGVVSGIGSFGVSTLLTVGASVAVGFALPFLEASLADIIAGSVVSGKTSGVDSGDAVFSGGGALLGGMAQSRGMKPANKGELKNYMAVTNEVKSDDIALEIYDARSKPFDVNEQYSFLGSFVRKINPAILKSSASLSGALLNIPTILKTSASALMPGVGAAEQFNDARFSKCNDPAYQDLGIDADIFCNVRYAMPTDELNMDSDTALDYMLNNGHIDDNGDPKSNSYKTWLETCVNRKEGWGEVGKDDGDTLEFDGHTCMGDGSNGEQKYFRVFTMDNGLESAMSDGPQTQGGSSDSSAPTGDVAATGDTKTLAKQIIDSPNVQFQTPGGKVAFQHIVDTGHAIACNATAISSDLLSLIATASQRYKITIGTLTDGHGCDGGRHSRGGAVDFTGVAHLDQPFMHMISYTSDQTPIAKEFYEYLDSISQPGKLGLGQSDCFGGNTPNLKKVVAGNFFIDGCDHMHVDVRN